jgi:2-keto-4-pentenoate hydratase/2-oxohepta-3-ene-1,7-dioic acid hydratase in catechol pathway
MQDASTQDMIFTVPFLISYISGFTHLEPGDVLATGTPAGVGAGRTPPLWLKSGDSIDIEIEHVGTLSNTVKAEAEV